MSDDATYAGESMLGERTSEEQGKEANHMIVSELKLYDFRRFRSVDGAHVSFCKREI